MAEAVHPSIKVAQVDADQHKELGGQYGVQGFPTIKVFLADKKKPQDYKGARTAVAMAQNAVQLLGEQVAIQCRTAFNTARHYPARFMLQTT